MPNNVDFSKVENVKKIQISPSGWINPLNIEYGTTEKLYPIPSYCWRVEGTQHTFIIPIVRMNFLSNGDYGKHFSETLEAFREDYLSWQKNDISWANEYKQQYSGFIVI